MVEALLDAMTMRPGIASVPAMTNQRPARRSYLIWGPKVLAPFRTGVKKTSVETLSTPSAAPVVFEKLRIRPFAARMNCAGPAAPLGSGGSEPNSPRVAPTYPCRNVVGSFASISVPDAVSDPWSATVAADSRLTVGRRTTRRRSSLPSPKTSASCPCCDSSSMSCALVA